VDSADASLIISLSAVIYEEIRGIFWWWTCELPVICYINRVQLLVFGEDWHIRPSYQKSIIRNPFRTVAFTNRVNGNWGIVNKFLSEDHSDCAGLYMLKTELVLKRPWIHWLSRWKFWNLLQLNLVAKNGKILPYSLSSVGPGADPGVEAVSPQVTWSHPPGSRLPLLSARPVVTFPAEKRHRPSACTKLYCLVTEAHACEQLAPGCYLEADQPRFETPTFRITSECSTVKPHRPLNSVATTTKLITGADRLHSHAHVEQFDRMFYRWTWVYWLPFVVMVDYG